MKSQPQHCPKHTFLHQTSDFYINVIETEGKPLAIFWKKMTTFGNLFEKMSSFSNLNGNFPGGQVTTSINFFT